MKKYTFLAFFFSILLSIAYTEEVCFNTLVQIEESSDSLSEEELNALHYMTDMLGPIEISAIYVAGSVKGKEVALTLSSLYKAPIIFDERIKKIAPNSLFRRIGEIRQFGADLLQAQVNKNVFIVADKTFVSFIGEYTKGGFSPLGNLCYIKIDFDGQSPYRP